MKRNMLTVEEVAERLHVSKETVRRRIRSGELQAVGGGHRRRWLIPVSSILPDDDKPLTIADIISLTVQIRMDAQRLMEKAERLELLLLSRQK